MRWPLVLLSIGFSFGVGCAWGGEPRGEVLQPEVPAGESPAPVADNAPVTPQDKSPLEIDEPGFKATVHYPEVPVVTDTAVEISGKKRPVRPGRLREFAVPQEEDAPPSARVDEMAELEPAAVDPSSEVLSPAVTKAIARERSGKKPREMVSAYAEIVKADPQDAAAHYRLGLALFRSGEIVKGMAALDTAVTLQPENPKYQCDYGLVALQAGSVEKALLACQTAALAVPSDARFQSAAGDCLVAAGRIFPALDAYTRAINLEPDNPAYIHNLGVATLHANSHKKALEMFEEAIRLRPTHAPYYCSRGIARERNKQTREAIGDYQRALALDKENAYAHFLLANVYSDPEDPTYANTVEALVHAQKAIKLTEGRNALYLMGMARALRAARNYDQAILAATQAIALSPRAEYKKELAEFERLKSQ